MIKKYFIVILFSLFFNTSCHANNPKLFSVNEKNINSSTQVKTEWLIQVYVTRVVDGDTIIVEINEDIPNLQRRERVRLLGVDTPETVHPNREVEFYGKEASDYTKMMLEGKNVYLAFDWDLRDRYGRLLAYIYLADGVCFNAVQIYYGYAHALTRYPFKFINEFRELEKSARIRKAGLWGE